MSLAHEVCAHRPNCRGPGGRGGDTLQALPPNHADVAQTSHLLAIGLGRHHASASADAELAEEEPSMALKAGSGRHNTSPSQRSPVYSTGGQVQILTAAAALARLREPP
ncbi:hypothetical protein PtB15_7B356 [Puccinia triticina]|nr:hypothetical protein PtB15_7B356 [Puccinia triticina]